MTKHDPSLLGPLLQELRESNYENLRVLDDGTIIGTINFIYTRGLCIDLNQDSWGHRYCYAERSMATAACLAMKTGDDEPLPGYVAQRHSKERPW
jgi:hypothetical protein